MQYLIVGAIVIGMLSSLGGMFLGARKSFNARTRQNIGIYQVSEDFQNADLGQVQKDVRTGPLQELGGIAEAGLSAQAVAAPGVAPNPIGLGLGEGISAGQYMAQFADESSSPDAPPADTSSGDSGGEASSGAATDPAAGDAGELREGGVNVTTAPDEYHVAWYATIDGERYLMVTPVGTFNHPERLTNLTSDAKSYDAFANVEPVSLTDAWAKSGDVVWRVGDSARNWRRTGDMYCHLEGVRYNCLYSEYLFKEYIAAWQNR